MDGKTDQQVSNTIPDLFLSSTMTKPRKSLEIILRPPQIDRDTQDHPDDTKMQKFSAMKLAEEIKVNLGAKHPTFVKTMVRSNVTTGYWLHLPMQFCKLHMPRHNATIVLEDEKGDEYKVNYLVDKSGVSGGWKVFTNAHNLIEGDILIFQLIRSSKFKIYIVRGNGTNEADAVPAVPTAETSTRHIASEDKKGKRIKFNRNASYLEIVPLNGLSNKIHKDDSLIGDDNLEHQADQSSKEKDGDANDLQIVPLNASPNINYEHDPMVVNGSLAHRVDHSREEHESTLGDMEAVDVSGPGLDFERVKSFEDFIILVNGVSIDSELSEHYRIKYFELCCKQKSFLHDHLLKKFNYKLAVEMITETVNIAEAIRVCTPSTFKANHAIWDKTLEGFEMLGMKVGFLRSWLNRLLNLCLDSERFRGAKHEQVHAEEEMKRIERRLLKLRRRMERLHAKMEPLKERAEKHELSFLEEANAPW